MKLTELQSAGESLATSEKALGEANARAEKLAMGVEDTTGRLAARRRRSPSWRSENVSRRQTWRRSAQVADHAAELETSTALAASIETSKQALEEGSSNSK